jgi:hypothetical protein
LKNADPGIAELEDARERLAGIHGHNTLMYDILIPIY